MLEMYARLTSLFRREEGQGLVEYALIIVLIAVALITALTLLGDDIEAVFTSIGGSLNP